MFTTCSYMKPTQQLGNFLSATFVGEYDIEKVFHDVHNVHNQYLLLLFLIKDQTTTTMEREDVVELVEILRRAYILLGAITELTNSTQPKELDQGQNQP